MNENLDFVTSNAYEALRRAEEAREAEAEAAAEEYHEMVRIYGEGTKCAFCPEPAVALSEYMFPICEACSAEDEDYDEPSCPFGFAECYDCSRCETFGL